VSIGESVTAKDPDDPGHLRAQIRGLTCIAEMIDREQPERAEALLLRAQTLATRFQAARRKTGVLFDTAAATVADVDQGLGKLYRQMKRFKEAEAAFRRAVAVNAKYASDFPSFRFYRERLAWSTENLANLLLEMANHDEAERVFGETIAMFDKLVADFPNAAIYRMGLANSQRGLVVVLDAAKRPEDAEKALRQARLQFVKVAKDAPDDAGARMSAAQVSRQLALRTRSAEEAEQLYRDALTLLQGLIAEHPDVSAYRSTLGDTHGRLATLSGDAGKFPEAEAFVRQSIAVFEKLAGEFPKKREYRQTLATIHEWRWVKIATAAGRPGDVDKAKRHALIIWQKLAADFPDEPFFWHKTGLLQQGFRQHQDALASFGKAVELQPDGWESWHWRGISHGSLGQWEKAVADQTAR
jgi:tetratricopeptide (TPR) repeat protein